jgi:hypothetical protein
VTERRAFGLLGLAALAGWLLVPQPPNYDAMYHLVWGRELLSGELPSYEAYAAPTPHPLYVLVAAVAGLAGERALVLVTVVSWVAMVWGAFRLGRATLGHAPAVLGAAFVASSFALLLFAARAYVDVPFLALVLWAAALTAERRERAVPWLLLVAGLLRPEAWVLAGLYALWSRRPLAFALAGAAPLTWALTDLVVTGNALHSLTSTSALAEALGRERGLQNVPRVFALEVVDVARPPVALLGAIGAVAAWRARRFSPVLAGLLLAGTLTFVAAGAAGLSLIPRYLTVPVIALMLLAGYGVLGFRDLAPSPLRTWWRRGAIAAAVLGVAFVVLRADVFARLTEELRFVEDVDRELVAIADDPRVREALRCGPITLPTYRLVPDLRWHLDDEVVVGARSARRRTQGVALFAHGPKTLRRVGFADGTSPLVNVPDPGFVPIARNDRFSAYAACDAPSS